MRQFRLTERAYHGARIRERGETIKLLPHELPGRHMIPVRVEAPTVPVIQPNPVAPPTTEPEAFGALVKALSRDPVLPKADPDRAFLEDMTQPVATLAPRSPGYLVIDTETNGFDDPRVASIAMIFADSGLCVEHEDYRLIRPDGWTMGKEAQAMNGLSMERLETEGQPIAGALHVFLHAVAFGRTIVAHNIAFDLRVMANELGKAGLGPAPMDGICTMLLARRAGTRGMLAIAHGDLCGSPLDDAHDALSDARACLNVLRALRRKGMA